MFISDGFGTDDPGLPTLILGSMLGLLLHYRLGPEITIKPARDLLINTIHSFQITLPLSLPAIASVALYVFMIAWNEFLFAFMFLDDPEIFTLSRGMVSLNSSEVPRQYLMAGAVMVTVPVMVLFFWFEKYLVSGLSAGAVKG